MMLHMSLLFESKPCTKMLGAYYLVVLLICIFRGQSIFEHRVYCMFPENFARFLNGILTVSVEKVNRPCVSCLIKKETRQKRKGGVYTQWQKTKGERKGQGWSCDPG